MLTELVMHWLASVGYAGLGPESSNLLFLPERAKGGICPGSTGQILLDICLDNLGISPIIGTAGLNTGRKCNTRMNLCRVTWVPAEYERGKATFTLSLLTGHFCYINSVKSIWLSNFYLLVLFEIQHMAGEPTQNPVQGDQSAQEAGPSSSLPSAQGAHGGTAVQQSAFQGTQIEADVRGSNLLGFNAADMNIDIRRQRFRARRRSWWVRFYLILSLDINFSPKFIGWVWQPLLRAASKTIVMSMGVLIINTRMAVSETWIMVGNNLNSHYYQNTRFQMMR
jgi:hypothetical protein